MAANNSSLDSSTTSSTSTPALTFATTQTPTNSTSQLKRPRSTSNPPSPSSSSSPKRAVSEDPPLLSPSMIGSAQASSPLRMDIDGEEGHDGRDERIEYAGRARRNEEDDDGQGSSEWVERTRHVSLDETQHVRALWDTVVGSIPPPFPAYATMYLLPKTFYTALNSQVGASGSSHEPDLDMSPLVEGEPVDVHVVETEPAAGSSSGEAGYTLVPRVRKDKVWKVKQGLSEDEDFIFISATGWQAIAQRYAPQVSLPRFCLPSQRIEMNPIVLTVYLVSQSTKGTTEPASASSPIRITLPTTAPLSLLLTLAASLSGVPTSAIPPPPMRLWSLDTPSDPASSDAASTLPALTSSAISSTLLPSLSGQLLDNTEQTIFDAGLLDGDAIAVEVGTRNGTAGVQWAVLVEGGKAVEKLTPAAPAPLFAKPAFYSGSGKSSASSSTSNTLKLAAPQAPQTRSQSRGRRGKGLVGLVNLGNTCFMNSAVQCLSNTIELNEYFLSGVYSEEINRDNPLGMGGAVAEAFGEVIEQLWTGSANSSFSPRKLKTTTSRFAQQFAGYGQHDTQEFIAFLLDGLHEDMNRIKKKPYIEKPDWKAGGGDKELALLGKECWDGYKKRNDSVIVDLFQGQLQSTLVCPECHKESITMDPFMYLTVPLPISQTRQFKCTFVPLDHTKTPVNVRLLIPANASFSAVKEKLGSLMGCSGSHIVGYDYWKGAVYSWWMDGDVNTEAKENDVAIFHELAVPTVSNHKVVGTQPTNGSITVPVFSFCTNDQKYSRNPYPEDGVYPPFFVTLSRAEAADPNKVRAAVMAKYAQLVRPEMRDKLWVSADAPQAAVPKDEDEVTEIHIDNVDGDENTEADKESAPAAPEQNEAAAAPAVEAPVASSSSSATTSASSSVDHLVPRGDLFKIHIADPSSANSPSTFNTFRMGKADPSIQPLYRGNPDKASGSWSRLETRKKPKRAMLERISSSLSSLVSGSAQNSDDESEPAHHHHHHNPNPNMSASTSLLPSTGGASGTATPTSTTGPTLGTALAVRPGEAIFVEWNRSDFDSIFFTPFDTKILDTFTDPAIEREAAKRKEGKVISIEDCLDEFSKEETLGQDDLWYCPVCKKHQAATKKLDIYKAPDILVICIKRFGSSRQMRDKLDHLVNFPVEGLDLEERIGERKIAKSMELTAEQAAEYGIETSAEPMIYDLYAVDNHFGGLGGGHYTAFCQNKEDSKWYNYDDSRVSLTDASSVQSRAAYLLFYRRRTTRPIGGISRIKAEEAEASRAASPVPPLVAGPSSHQVTHRSAAWDSSDEDDFGHRDQMQSIDSVGPASPISLPRNMDDDDELPSYSHTNSPNLPSPTLSDEDTGLATPASGAEGGTSRESEVNVHLGSVGASLGFGNTAWGSSSAGTGTGIGAASVPLTRSGPTTSTGTGTSNTIPSTSSINFNFGSATAAVNESRAQSGSGVTTSVTVAPPSPPASDEEFVRAPTPAGGEAAAETGLGEEYDVVRPSSRE